MQMFAISNTSFHSAVTWFVLTMFVISLALLIIQTVLCALQRDRQRLPPYQRKTGLRPTSASKMLLLGMVFVLSLNFLIFLMITARPETSLVALGEGQVNESSISPISKIVFWPVFRAYSRAVGAASATFDSPSR